jgi:hypothetical protein
MIEIFSMMLSTLDWIVQLLELHAEQDEEDEPEDEE